MTAALRVRAASRQHADYLQGPAPRGRPVHPPVRGVMAAAAGADAVKGLVSKCAAERRGRGDSPKAGACADLAYRETLGAAGGRTPSRGRTWARCARTTSSSCGLPATP